MGQARARKRTFEVVYEYELGDRGLWPKQT